MLVIRGKQPLSEFNWFVNNLEIIYRIKLHLSEKVLFNTNDFIVSQTFYVMMFFILITYLLIVMNAFNNSVGIYVNTGNGFHEGYYYLFIICMQHLYDINILFAITSITVK